MTEQKQTTTGIIRPCGKHDTADILRIINEAAKAYRGVIPALCWHEPYMSAAELDHEIAAGVRFSVHDVGGSLTGVMGIQHRNKVDLIRHAYVRPVAQGKGIGRMLLASFLHPQHRPMLVGTWKAAHWAIRFYERNGFGRVPEETAPALLHSHWTVSDLQIASSIVLSKT